MLAGKWSVGDGISRLQSGIVALVAAVAAWLALAAPALADCQPDPAVSGQTVTCTATPPDLNGFQAGVGVNQLTVNVLTGVTVQNLGGIVIGVNNLNTVTNNGTLLGGDNGTGISAGNQNTIVNSATGRITMGDAAIGVAMVDNNVFTNLGIIEVGTLTGCGCSVGGVLAGDRNTITNANLITGGDFAFGIGVDDRNTVTNSGTMTLGADGLGIGGGNNNTITNNAGATITVGDSVIAGAAGILVHNQNTVANFGTIRVGSTTTGFLPAVGIFAGDRNTISNAGAIIGGDAAAGVFAADRNTITNAGTITMGQDGAGIVGQNRNTITNAAGATITVGDAVNVGAFGISVDNNNNITNLGTINVGSSCGCVAASGIDAGSGNTIVNGGKITVGDFGSGISAFNGNTITNAGTIVVGSNSPFGLAGGIFVVDNNTVTNAAGASITAGTFGVGVNAGNDNILTNNGTINVGFAGTAVLLSSGNTFTNNGILRAINGFSIATCGPCSQDNVIVNNGTADGALGLVGLNQSLTNNGLITITDPNTPVGISHIVEGSFVQGATGTLALRVDATGVSDALGPTPFGTLNATLGGTLRAVVQPGLYANSTTYFGVVAATDPIITTFGQTTSSSPFFTATATYNTFTVDLTLNRIAFGSVPGETQNQRNVGNYLEQNYSTSLTGNAATFFSNLFAATSLSVLDSLSGEGTTAGQQAAFNIATMFTTTMFDQMLSWLQGGGFGGDDLNPASPLLQYAAEDKRQRPEYKAFSAIRPEAGAFRRQPWRAWMTAFGGSQSFSGDAVIGSASSSNRIFGAAGGIDYQVNPNLLVGLAGAGSNSSFSVPGRATTGTLDGAHIGVYGAYRWGAAYVAGTLSYSHFNNLTTRTIAGVGPTETAIGAFGSDQFGGRLQVGYKFVFDRFAVTPFAAVQYAQLWQHAYAEASFAAGGVPGILGLNVQSRSISSLPTFLGAQLDTRVAVPYGMIWVPFVRAAWVHEFMPDRTIAAAMGILPTGTFVVDGPRAASDAARIEAGSNLYLLQNVSLFGKFVGEYSAHTSSSAGNGGLRVTW